MSGLPVRVRLLLVLVILSNVTGNLFLTLGVRGGCILTVHSTPSASAGGRSSTVSIAAFHSGSRPTSVMRSKTACGVASTCSEARPWISSMVLPSR